MAAAKEDFRREAAAEGAGAGRKGASTRGVVGADGAATAAMVPEQ